MPISLLLILLLPNVAKSFFAVPGLNGHLLSIGVEEQFYLIWPWIVKLTKSKLIFFLIAIVMILPVIRNLPFILTKFNLIEFQMSNYLIILVKFFKLAMFDYMAFGGIIAILYYKNYPFNSLFDNKFIIITLYFLIIITLVFNIKIPFIGYDYFAYLSGILIFSIARNCNSKSILELDLLKYLGKISYGIYMYHPVAIMLSIYMFKYYITITGGTIFLILFQVSSFIYTILIASISYKYIEAPLLKLKQKIVI